MMNLYRRTFVVVIAMLLVMLGSAWSESHPGRVGSPSSTERLVAGPALTIPDKAPVEAGHSVAVPVTFTANGNDVSTLVFSIDYDQRWLRFDPTDGDADGIPDAITFNTPAAFTTSATFDAGDTDSEIDILVADLVTPLATLPDGNVLSITFAAGLPTESNEVTVNFSQAPAASFGTPAGESTPGTTSNGSVVVSCPSFVVSPVGAADVQAQGAKWHLDPQGGDLDGDGDADVVDVMRLVTWWGRSCN